MNGTKTWTQSTGMTGSLAAIVAVIVMVLNAFGIKFGIPQPQLVAALAALVAFGGNVMGFIGRLKATTTIVSHKTAKQAAKAVAPAATTDQTTGTPQ